MMLAYRSSNTRDKEKWSAIMDENATLTLPITPYRSFNKGDIVNSSRLIKGIDAMMADSASLALMVESIGQGSNLWKESIIR